MSKRQESQDWWKGYWDTECKLRNAGPDKVHMLRLAAEQGRGGEYQAGALHAVEEAETALARTPALTLVRKRQ